MLKISENKDIVARGQLSLKVKETDEVLVKKNMVVKNCSHIAILALGGDILKTQVKFASWGDIYPDDPTASYYEMDNLEALSEYNVSSGNHTVNSINVSGHSYSASKAIKFTFEFDRNTITNIDGKNLTEWGLFFNDIMFSRVALESDFVYENYMTVVGEWTIILTDCSGGFSNYLLNQYSLGALWAFDQLQSDGTVEDYASDKDLSGILSPLLLVNNLLGVQGVTSDDFINKNAIFTGYEDEEATNIDYVPDTDYIGNDAYTIMLLHMNSGFNDVSEGGNNHDGTPQSDAQISSAQSKFGAYSALFDGTDDYIDVPDDDDFIFGTDDFSIDFWVRFNSIATSQGFFQQRVDNNNRIGMLWKTSNSIQYYVRIGGSDQILMQANWTPSINTWYHITLSRTGSTFQIFVDGVDITTSGGTSSYSIPDLAATFYIARYDGSTPRYLNGYIDEFRIVKGVSAINKPDDPLYLNGGATFTPPTEQYEDGIESTIQYNKVVTTQNVYNNIPYTTESIFENSTNKFTIWQWFKMKSVTDLDDEWTLISRWITNNDTASYSSYRIYLKNEATTDTMKEVYLKSDIYVGSTKYTLSSDVLDLSDDDTINLLGRWNHVALSYGYRKLRFYLNGVKVDEQTTYYSPTFGYDATLFIGTQQLSLAEPTTHDQNKVFLGFVDETGISVDVMTDNAISLMYNNGVGDFYRP